jgi:guanylate kinase
MKKGLLVVVSGPAGSGKGTVDAHLLKRDDFVYSVSATTRAPRPGEVDGVHYHFISVEEFKERLERGDMIEYTQYCGNFYGTPKKEAEEVLASGRNLILEIEVEGAHNVKAKYPEAVLILLLPPSYSVQEQRLRGRGTETEEKILERLAAARQEVTFANDYDYIVYNHDGKDADAAEEILHIVMAEKAAISRNPNVAELYLKG